MNDKSLTWSFWLLSSIIKILLGGAAFLLLYAISQQEALLWTHLLSTVFWQALLVGFLAQIIDGTLGMAYGISCNSFLLAQGFPPATASAAVHIAEIFTTGFSGLAHIRHHNVDKRLFTALALAGISGAAVGALLLSHLGGQALRFWIDAYLFLMGAALLYKAIIRRHPQVVPYLKKRLISLTAVVGGALDAIGGGGWGAVVVVNLVQYSGISPRVVIGTVNTVEFFLTFTVSMVLVLNLADFSEMTALILGLIFGGSLAAPFSARLLHLIPAQGMMLLLGLLIMGLSLWRMF